jgi:cytochrome c oxidase cbb3-type subunit 3
VKITACTETRHVYCLPNMSTICRRKWFLRVSATLIATSISLSQSTKPPQKPDPASASGKELFASSCAACHGLDGKGSERAPNIADGANVRQMSHTQIADIIRNGSPGGGMPAFHTLSSAQIEALIHHLEMLSGANKPAQLRGDPAVGKTLFTGKAGCSRCHMVLGQGGFIASNLSEYGKDHSGEQIRDAIINSGGSASRSAKTATIRLRNGDKYAGRVRNEDNFSIQLQDTDGAFHLLSRSDVMNLEYDPKPVMPSDYATTLSPNELDDLESYLINVAGHPLKKDHKSNAADCFPWCDSED